MPALFECQKCGGRYWDLKPHSPKEIIEAIHSCSVFLVKGKFCPHCGHESPHAPHPDVYKESLLPGWSLGKDLYETPPDEKELEQVAWAMAKAWSSGSDYIAESKEMYFRYAVPIMDHYKMKRIPPGKTMYTSDGREFIMDTYQGLTGKTIKIGYESKQKRLGDESKQIRLEDKRCGMKIHRINLDANSEYKALVKKEGKTLTLTFSTNEKGLLKDFPDLEGINPNTPNTYDFIKLENLTTGVVKDLRLHTASFYGNIKLAEEALADKVDTEVRLKQDATPLHWAAHNGYFEIVKLLIENGADKNSVDSLGWTPVFLAINNNHHRIVKYLMSQLASAYATVNGKEMSIRIDPATKDFYLFSPNQDDVDLFEKYARQNRPFISNSSEEHFNNVVSQLDLIGAKRLGSQRLKDSGGKSYIIDQYILPSGCRLKAGYPD